MLHAVGLLARRGAQSSSLGQAARALVNAPRVCSYATEAPKADLTALKVDLKVDLHSLLSGVPGKYALALHSAAVKTNAVDKVEKDLVEVDKLAASSAQFKQFLVDPSVSRKIKISGLKSVLSKAGVSATVQNMLALLVENGRVGLLDKIAEQYRDLTSATRGEVKATITTAEPLTEADVAGVRSQLTAKLDKGQKLFLRQKVDPTIIGGIILDVGDKHIDLSILSRVKKVQQMILEMT